MQAVGIVLISAGIWIVYCGYLGISPIDTFKDVVANPDQARNIIAKAKAETLTKLATMGVGTLSPGANPFSEWKITDTFEGHKARGSAGGVDFGAPVGTPIVAPAAGMILVRPNNGAMGNAVFIKHAQSGYESQFYHLSKFSVGSGETVKAGQVVGLSGGARGAAGSGSSTGAHIHWTVLDPSGRQVDPLKVLGKL